MKLIACQLYSSKAVKTHTHTHTHSEPSNYQGTSTIIPNSDPCCPSRPVRTAPAPWNILFLPPASSKSICPSKTRTSPTSCREPFTTVLIPDSQCTCTLQLFYMEASSLIKQKLSSLRPGTLSSRSFVYLHSSRSKKPQLIPVDCFVDDFPTERSPS